MRMQTIANFIIVGERKQPSTWDHLNNYYLKPKNKGMKVVLAGPSGSGKTTLAKALAEHFGWEFVENSAGKIMLPEDKETLKHEFGYEGNWGQRKVINESHIKTVFGRKFQSAVLNARYNLMHEYYDKNCVFDRSALDPIVFYLNQVVHNDEQQETEHFLHRCIAGMREVDLILRIPLQNPNQEIENNESRVSNWYFQRKIDSLYDVAIDIFLRESKKNKYLVGSKRFMMAESPGWDWNLRLDWGKQMINRLVSGRY